MPRKNGPALSEYNESKGFTLIELLVTISIVAILSVIGITIYSNLQKGARDAKRKADINAIAQAMEINKNRFTPGSYSKLCQKTTTPTYDCDEWFGGGVPTDPKGISPSVYHWCDPTDAGNNPVCANASNVVDQNSPDGRANWMVCASLEAGGKFCKTNNR